MVSLPSGWTEARLGELASDVTYGYTARSSSEPIGPRMLRITDIQDDRVDWSTVPYCQITDQDLQKYKLERGDLLFARTGATVGKSFLIRDEISQAVYASYLIRVRCRDYDLSRYLSYFFRSPMYWSQITDFSVGIGQPNVNGSKLQQLRIPLAPAEEQRRIANKLDRLLAAVETCKARLDAIPAILKRLRQSVLAAAASGELTEEWRQFVAHTSSEYVRQAIHRDSGFKKSARKFSQALDPAAAPASWYVTHLGEVISVRSGDGLTAKNMKKGTVPVYGGNGISGYHDATNVNRPALVIGRVGFYCGSVHVTPPRAWVTDNALIVSFPESAVDFQFLHYLLRATNLRENDSSSAQPVISGQKIYSLVIRVPPLEEQREIARRVDLLMAVCDQMEAKVNSASARVEELTARLLAKAFTGELVSQDPNDERGGTFLARTKSVNATAQLHDAGVGLHGRARGCAG